MTDDDLTALEALCNAATAGPWKWAFDAPEDGTYDALNCPERKHVLFAAPVGYENSVVLVEPADAAFIAAARTALPALIAEVRQLRDQHDAVIVERGHLREWIDRLTAERDQIRARVAELEAAAATIPPDALIMPRAAFDEVVSDYRAQLDQLRAEVERLRATQDRACQEHITAAMECAASYPDVADDIAAGEHIKERKA